MSSTTYDRRRTKRHRWLKLLLLVGFVALTGALVVALRARTWGYEPSIYLATPDLFWVGVAVALAVALVVGFRAGDARRLRQGGLLLGGTAAWSIVALPLVRGYYFYGTGDALSHLGFARMFAGGTMDPSSLLHPGVHLVSVSLSTAAGHRLGRSVVLGTLAFALVFFVFVPLCVREITGDDRGAIVGLFAAALLLPLNNVSTHLTTHPSSQTILFVPFVLFLLFVYLRTPVAEGRRTTPVGILLALAGVAVVFTHPEQAMNLIVIFGVVALAGFVYRRVKPDHAISEHRPLYFQTAFLAVVFLLWAPRSQRVHNRLELMYESFFVTQPSAGSEVSQYSGSIAAVGGSLETMLVKLFLPALVFSVIVGLFMLASVAGWLDDAFPDRNALAKYLTFAYVPLLAGTVAIMAANMGDHYFRYIGFLMMIVTILGAAALTAVPSVLGGRLPKVGTPTLRGATLVLFVLLLPVAALTVHPSPWIHQTSPHITEATMDGYRTAFEHRDPGTQFAGVRAGPKRFVHAVYGPRSAMAEGFPGAEDRVPYRVMGNNVTTFYDDARYIPVTRADVYREVRVYRGFRYSASDFRRLETTPGLSRVQSNDAFRLYRLVNEQE